MTRRLPTAICELSYPEEASEGNTYCRSHGDIIEGCATLGNQLNNNVSRDWKPLILWFEAINSFDSTKYSLDLTIILEDGIVISTVNLMAFETRNQLIHVCCLTFWRLVGDEMSKYPLGNWKCWQVLFLLTKLFVLFYCGEVFRSG